MLHSCSNHLRDSSSAFFPLGCNQWCVNSARLVRQVVLACPEYISSCHYCQPPANNSSLRLQNMLPPLHLWHNNNPDQTLLPATSRHFDILGYHCATVLLPNHLPTSCKKVAGWYYHKLETGQPVRLAGSITALGSQQHADACHMHTC